MGLGGREWGKGIEGAKAARLECTCCRQGTLRGPPSISSSLPPSRPQVPPHRHAAGALSAAWRFRALAGDAGMSILLAGVVVWISVVGLLAWPWLRGWDGAVPTWSRSECIACAQILGVSSPPPPLLPLPHPAVRGVQRGLEGIWYCRHCRCCFSRSLPAPH